jgi:hypothetical protein
MSVFVSTICFLVTLVGKQIEQCFCANMSVFVSDVSLVFCWQILCSFRNVVSLSHHTKMELSYLLSLADITSTGVVLPHDAQTKGSFRNHTCACRPDYLKNNNTILFAHFFVMPNWLGYLSYNDETISSQYCFKVSKIFKVLIHTLMEEVIQFSICKEQTPVLFIIRACTVSQSGSKFRSLY